MHEKKIKLSPAYDLLSSTISMVRAIEELALPLAGKKKRITKKNLLVYYGKERLQLTEKTIQSELQNIINSKSSMEELISISFLSAVMKEKYLELLSERFGRLVD